MIDVFVDGFRHEFTQRMWTDFTSGPFLRFVGTYLVGAALFFIFFERRRTGASWRSVVEYVLPKYIVRHPHFRVDVLNVFLRRALLRPLVQGLVVVVTFVMGVSVSEALVEWLGARRPLLHATWSIVTAQVAAQVLLASFAHYWMHRFAHEMPFWWSFHRAHHSAEVLSIFTVDRTSIGESILVRIVSGIWMSLTLGACGFLLGVNPHPYVVPTLLAYNIITGSLAIFQHSHVPISLGKLDYLIVSPLFHHIHHSAERRHHDRNYAGDFAFWDWIFGTLYLPKEEETFRLGLDKERAELNPHQSVLDLHVEPFVHMWKTLKREGLRSFIPSDRIRTASRGVAEAPEGIDL